MRGMQLILTSVFYHRISDLSSLNSERGSAVEEVVANEPWGIGILAGTSHFPRLTFARVLPGEAAATG